MIAKRITSKASKSHYARLAKYVVAAQGGIDPRSWSRTADYMLASGMSNRGEKVGGVRVTNCNTDDPAAATTLIEVTQAVNTRSKADKTYHLVFSFPPGEEPDIKTLNYIEDQLVASIGYSDHQRISAVHVDCDHLHVHVAINKVHPKGFQNIEPYYDKKKLMEACERLEIELGLQRTNHGLTGEMTKKEKAKIRLQEKQAQAEAHSGIESLTGYVTREVAAAIHKAANWQELHAALAEHGLQIKPRGAGLVIGSEKLWVKASDCDRAFSMKKLTDRLGPYQQSAYPASKAYTPKPQQQHQSSTALYVKYQHEREVAKVVRSNELEKLRYESEMAEYKLKKWGIAQRHLIKATVKAGPKRRAMLKIVTVQTNALRANNYRSAAAKRKSIVVGTAIPSWSHWLTHQAENGNTEALAVLRSRQDRETMRGNTITAKKQSDKNPVMGGMEAHADKDGLMTYRTADGGIVIDRKTHVQAFRTTAASTILALELAARRYEGQILIVEGQEKFKADVARLAAERGIKVKFANHVPQHTRKPHLEKGAEL